MAGVPSTASPRRKYQSVKRKQRARETRERILGAAGAEFLRSGYAGTTIRGIAEAAGVSVPMVELAFGTKAQLLHATIRFAIRGDAAPLPMLEREWARSAREAASADEFLAIVAAVLCESAARSAGLVIAAFEAAHLDRSMGGLADRLRAQRTETAGWIVDGVIERSALRAGLTREQAIDTVWLLMDPHVFRALTWDRGWSRGQFEQWFAESVRRLLLSSQTRPRKRGDR
jgi:AcrR family transcriptional regulator